MGFEAINESGNEYISQIHVIVPLYPQGLNLYVSMLSYAFLIQECLSANLLLLAMTKRIKVIEIKQKLRKLKII